MATDALIVPGDRLAFIGIGVDPIASKPPFSHHSLKNRWDPYVDITHEMAVTYKMDLKDPVRAIGTVPTF